MNSDTKTWLVPHVNISWVWQAERSVLIVARLITMLSPVLARCASCFLTLSLSQSHWESFPHFHYQPYQTGPSQSGPHLVNQCKQQSGGDWEEKRRGEERRGWGKIRDTRQTQPTNFNTSLTFVKSFQRPGLTGDCRLYRPKLINVICRS